MIRNTLSLSAAAVFAVLALSVAALGQATDAPKVEVGVQFTSLSVNPPDFFTGTEHRPGFGGRLTYNINDHVAVEGEGNFFPTRGISTFATGGSAAQGQFGVKAGKRWEKFGVFAKARPGFVSFSRTLRLAGTETIIFEGESFVVPHYERDRRTSFSTDLGGVFELYASRRIMARFDIGDTIIRHGERQSLFLGSTPVNIPREYRHNFQFSAGVGFRF
ncbi:MAG TPA: outer membrane beta-barrel protein [Pyrinomonadaceae bacterium]|jgi:hypothetical protein|nr:outer membrane beta-barrel protein [Pyrinomonadaceae bacterium]